jgi:hypothetical protein
LLMLCVLHKIFEKYFQSHRLNYNEYLKNSWVRKCERQILCCKYCRAYVWQLYKTGIGLTTGFIGSHTVTITVYTLYNSLCSL